MKLFFESVLVPKFRLGNRIVKEALLLVMGSRSFLCTCVPKSELGNEIERVTNMV